MTDEDKGRLLDLWAGGEHSLADIAAVLGVTKGVVNGVVARARAAGDPRAIAKPSPIRRVAPPVAPPEPDPERPRYAMPPAVTAPPVVSPVTYRVCRWPSGDSPRVRFDCQAATAPGKPYCDRHCAIAFRRRGEVEDAA